MSKNIWANLLEIDADRGWTLEAIKDFSESILQNFIVAEKRERSLLSTDLVVNKLGRRGDRRKARIWGDWARV